MGDMKSDDKYGEEEIARRRDELARRMLNMPPQPLKTKGKANPSTKRKERPASKGRVHKGKTDV